MPTVTKKPVAPKKTEDPRAVKARKMDALVRSIAASKSETADIDAQPVKKVAVKRIVAAKPQHVVKKEAANAEEEPKEEVVKQEQIKEPSEPKETIVQEGDQQYVKVSPDKEASNDEEEEMYIERPTSIKILGKADDSNISRP